MAERQETEEERRIRERQENIEISILIGFLTSLTNLLRADVRVRWIIAGFMVTLQLGGLSILATMDSSKHPSFQWIIPAVEIGGAFFWSWFTQRTRRRIENTVVGLTNTERRLIELVSWMTLRFFTSPDYQALETARGRTHAMLMTFVLWSALLWLLGLDQSTYQLIRLTIMHVMISIPIIIVIGIVVLILLSVYGYFTPQSESRREK